VPVSAKSTYLSTSSELGTRKPSNDKGLGSECESHRTARLFVVGRVPASLRCVYCLVPTVSRRFHSVSWRRLIDSPGSPKPGISPSMYPYAALRTAKIRTPITLGVRHRAKPLVFKIRKRLPRGFDSHRPLHSRATPDHAGLQDWGQDIDPMGNSWESTPRGGGGLMASRIPALPRDSHVQSHAAVHKNKLCDSHAALVARAIAGGWTRPVAAFRHRPLTGSLTQDQMGLFQA
jgi:hypothetical protein